MPYVCADKNTAYLLTHKWAAVSIETVECHKIQRAFREKKCLYHFSDVSQYKEHTHA